MENDRREVNMRGCNTAKKRKRTDVRKRNTRETVVNMCTEDEGIRPLRNVCIIRHNYTVSQPVDGGSMELQNVAILPQHYRALQPEDGGSMELRNVGILPQHYTALQPEDGGSMELRNVFILPQHYTTQQGVTTQKTMTCPYLVLVTKRHADGF
jgi:hypothetical protein